MNSVTRILTFTQHFEMQQQSVHKNLNSLSLIFLWRKWQSIQRVASVLKFYRTWEKIPLLNYNNNNNNILTIKIKISKHICFIPHGKINEEIIKSQRGVFEFWLRPYCYLNKTSIVSDAWILGPQLMVLFRPVWNV